MRGLSQILSLFRNKFNKFKNTVARMLDSIYHVTLRLLLKLISGVKEIRFCHYKKIWERSGSVVECLTRDEGPRVRASRVSLCCVLEQDTLILA